MIRSHKPDLFVSCSRRIATAIDGMITANDKPIVMMTAITPSADAMAKNTAVTIHNTANSNHVANDVPPELGAAGAAVELGVPLQYDGLPDVDHVHRVIPLFPDPVGSSRTVAPTGETSW